MVLMIQITSATSIIIIIRPVNLTEQYLKTSSRRVTKSTSLRASVNLRATKKSISFIHPGRLRRETEARAREIVALTNLRQPQIPSKILAKKLP